MRQNAVLCGNGLTETGQAGGLTLYHTTPTFKDSEKEAFGKHCGKRRKCQHFLFYFESCLFCRLQMLSIWTSLKFCCLVNTLVTK